MSAAVRILRPRSARFCTVPPQHLGGSVRRYGPAASAPGARLYPAAHRGLPCRAGAPAARLLSAAGCVQWRACAAAADPDAGAAGAAASKLTSAQSIVSPFNNQHLIATLQLGSFSEQDVEGAFRRIDADGDGRISAADLTALFGDWAERRSLSEQRLETMVQAFMAKWDDDKSGDIDSDEFKRHALALGEQVHPVIYQLAACIFLMCVPFGIIVPYEPQLVAGLGISAAQFGAAQGAMFATKFLVNIPVTDVVDRFGSKPILVGSTALLGLSVGGLSLVSSLEHLIMCRAIGGVAAAGLFASIQAPAISVQTPLNRARSSAPFTQAMNAGVALGPAIGGMLSEAVGMEAAFAGVGSAFLLCAAANYKIYAEAAPATGSKFNNPLELFTHAFGAWRSVLESSIGVRALCATQTVLWAAVAGTNMTLLPLLLSAEPLSFTASSIGMLSAGLATLGVVVTQPLAVLADKYGRPKALLAGSGLMGCSMALVPVMGTPAMVSGAMASMALGQNLLAPSIGALMIDLVAKQDPSKITQAMSLLRSVQDVGMVSGAALIGAIGTVYGFTAAYEVSSSIVLIMGIAAYFRLPPPPSRAKL
uniref:Calmodulin n=1 Tax=Alexandrium catenella TaxID=2925 RepID=A0A7S1S5X5_ALECA